MTAKPRSPRPTVRRYYTETAACILADCYGGQVRAVVIERALREMAIRDGLLTPKTHKPTRRGNGGTS